jgi:transcription elongation factor Elf1
VSKIGRSVLKKRPTYLTYSKYIKIVKTGRILLTKQGKQLLQKGICPYCERKELTQTTIPLKYAYRYECRHCGSHYWYYPKNRVVIVADAPSKWIRRKSARARVRVSTLPVSVVR